MKFNFSLNTPEYQKAINIEGYRTMDGNYLFDSHPEIDIVIDKTDGKVITFPKEEVGFEAYDTQNRMMVYFSKKGIIDRSSIRAGNVSNSLLAKLLTPEDDIDQINVCMLGVYNFLKIEEPYFKILEDFEDDFEDDTFDPDPEHSTELGEVPHQERKGSVPPGKYYGYGYGYRPYVYESVKKERKLTNESK